MLIKILLTIYIVQLVVAILLTGAYYICAWMNCGERFTDKLDDVTLPNFRKGTMYKGMKLEKAYTLDELGL